MAARTLGTQDERDQGMTLVELAIAMVVAGLVAAMVATTTIQAFRIQRATTVRETDSTNASLAMETLTRDLRQAVNPQLPDGTSTPAFTTAQPAGATFVTWVGVDPVKVTYTLSAGQITRSVQRADTPGKGAQSTFSGTGATTTGRLVGSVTSPVLFQYRLSDGSTPTAVSSLDDLKIISGVTVSLTVDSDAAGSLPGTTLTNTVDCQNL